MSRTLRGFESEFPYSVRGDTSDAHIIDEEEAYGYYNRLTGNTQPGNVQVSYYGYAPDDEFGYDPEGYFGDEDDEDDDDIALYEEDQIFGHYGADAEGEDDDEIIELEGDIEESGKFRLFKSTPWLIPAAAGVGAGILGTALIGGLVRKRKRSRLDNEDFGAIGDAVATEFGSGTFLHRSV